MAQRFTTSLVSARVMVTKQSRVNPRDDIHQSTSYTRFMRNIGWIVEDVDGMSAFIKKFPLIGSVIKIQRSNKIPSHKKLFTLKKKYRAISLTLEPNFTVNHLTMQPFNRSRQNYLPTKTIHIDLKQSEEKLFKSFSESTRRAVRRAMKNNVRVEQSTDIDAFIKLKSQSFWPFGFLFTRDIKPLWQTMYPRNARLLLASHNHLTMQPFNHVFPVAGILLLFYGKNSYYWLAVSSREGNAVAAPTLLVWEALKLGKKKRCTVFDFEGIYDERFPSQNKEWLGFSKFKKGFGGKEIYFPKPLALFI